MLAGKSTARGTGEEVPTSDATIDACLTSCNHMGQESAGARDSNDREDIAVPVVYNHRG